LAASPFLALSTWDTEGGSDTSPRGDRQTVARILNGRTLVLADRKGNRRADTLHNLLHDDRIALAALVPGRSGVLHIHGRAAITDDKALLKTLALRGEPPHLALLIDVEDAEIRSNDAVARARLWNPDTRPGRDKAPDMMAVGSAHLAAGAAQSGRASAWLIKLITATPGMSRLLRKVADRAYVSGLRKEGYDDVRAPAAAHHGATQHDQVAESPLRAVRVCGIRQETPSARTLVLEDSAAEAEPFHFRPGQFFTLVTDLAGHPVRRAYSASSAPGAHRLEVTVKQVKGGKFSTHAHSDLRVGDRLAVRGPSGTFHAPPQSTEQLVLIAAGSGITPMMSMIRARLSDPAPAGRISLLYSSRSPEEVIFGDELTRMEKDHPDRLTVTHVLTGRDEIVFIAFGVIMATLVLQGLSLPWLVRKLKVKADTEAEQSYERDIALRAAKAAKRRLKEIEEVEELPEEVQEQLLRRAYDIGLRINPELGAEERREAQTKRLARVKRIRHIQNEMMSAARHEVLAARSEPGADPEIVDRILRQLDVRSMR
ncbi:FAD-binding oxidoreductase, partial [Streptomyces sp. SID5785]|uniref:FAD-binding oxidoreductase n=1 Tax=Streptomyces sp. SID5785 TaxID=2690309 RepID=UPI001F1F69D9